MAIPDDDNGWDYMSDEDLKQPIGLEPYVPLAERRRAAAARVKTAFRVWKPSEIWAPLEAPEYIVDGLLVRGALMLVVAYGSSLKTWLLEDLALSVATGRNWLERFPTRQGKALIVDFESGDYELRRRAHLLARGRELRTPLQDFAFVSFPESNLAEDAFFVALEPLAGEYSFIGIDSLAAGSGGIDENDARFARSLNRLKAIAAKTGCTIVLLHHAKKSSGSVGGQRGGDDADPREMVRGTSAIFNACDVVLQMSRAPQGAFVVRQTKARGGKSVEPFVVRAEDTGPGALVVSAKSLEQEQDGQELQANGNSIDKAKRGVLVLLSSEHGLTSKNQICNRLTGDKRAKLKAIDELLECGLITTTKGTWRLASDGE